MQSHTGALKKKKKRTSEKKKGGIARKLYPRFLSSDLKATALFEKENSDGPWCFPLSSPSRRISTTIASTILLPAKLARNQTRNARTIMAFCVYLYRRRFARVTSDRERISRSLAYNAKQQKNPLSSSVRFAETFLVVSEFFNAIRKFELVVVSFLFVFSFLFPLSPFPSSFSLFLSIINAMETPNIEWFCLMFQLFRRKQ